jgi:hypothetical protein
MYHGTFPVVIIIISLTFSVLISGILTNVGLTDAQHVSPNTPKIPLRSLSLNSSQPPAIPKLHSIRITSPAKAQQVSTSKNLTVSGITITAPVTTNINGNATSPHCHVSVIVNGVKPYQPAKGTGPGGEADYSTWSYILSSKYTTMKQGPSNKITAKYSCTDNPKASYYSVNVTGIAEAMPVRTTIGKSASQNADRTSTVTTAAHPLSSKNLIYLGKTVSNDYHFSNGSIKASYNNDSISHVPNSTMVSGRILSTSSGSANTTIHSNDGDTGFATNSKPARSSSYPILNPSLHSMTNELKNRIIEKLRNKDSFQIQSHN